MPQSVKGKLCEHHRFLISDLLVHLDFLDEQIAQIEERIEAKLSQMPPFQSAVCLLDTIPGVNRLLAILIVAEVGVDMSRFPSDRHLTAWAGVAPGNNETGGKQRSGKTRKGNKYLKQGLVLTAHGAAHKKINHLRSLYYRLSARRGKPKAAVAVGRTILQMAYHMILHGEEYRELGEAYLDQINREQTAKRLVKRLVALGYIVNVKVQTVAPEVNARPMLPLPVPLAI